MTKPSKRQVYEIPPQHLKFATHYIGSYLLFCTLTPVHLPIDTIRLLSIRKIELIKTD